MRELRPRRESGRLGVDLSAGLTVAVKRLDSAMADLDAGMVAPRIQNDGRSIIATAFDLLDQVAALEPVRLIDLAEATGIPHPTVHRLLRHIIRHRNSPNLSVEQRGSWMRDSPLNILPVDNA